MLLLVENKFAFVKNKFALVFSITDLLKQKYLEKEKTKVRGLIRKFPDSIIPATKNAVSKSLRTTRHFLYSFSDFRLMASRKAENSRQMIIQLS
jgi:hypothetical protein